MKFIGAHVSFSNGIDKIAINAKKINATAFAFFTKNQLQWKSKPLQMNIVEKFKKNCIKYGYKKNQIIAHASYLINLGHPNIHKLEKSRKAFIEEIKRCEMLGVNLLNIHPGSHLNEITIDQCISRISESINITLSKTNNVIVVLENTSGQGSNIGFLFEQLIEIINNIEDKNRIGVCLDTCHAFTSIYDLRTKQDCYKTFYKFNKIIGFKYLRAMHLNDSKRQFYSRIDRHQSLGKGYIGYNAFSYIMKDSRFENIPLILETIKPSLWNKEIKWLKSQYT